MVCSIGVFDLLLLHGGIDGQVLKQLVTRRLLLRNLRVLMANELLLGLLDEILLLHELIFQALARVVQSLAI